MENIVAMETLLVYLQNSVWKWWRPRTGYGEAGNVVPIDDNDNAEDDARMLTQ